MAVKNSKIKFNIGKNKADAVASGADESTIYFANTYDESTGKPTNAEGIVVGGQIFGEPNAISSVTPTETAGATIENKTLKVNVLKVPNKLKIKTTGTGYTEYDGSESMTVDTVYAATKATQDASGNVITSTYATKTDLNNIGSIVQGLTGALKFVGTADSSGDTTFTDGMTTKPVTVGGSSITPSAGNVVIQGSNEYAWTGSKWVLLGIPTVGVTQKQTSGTVIATVTANGKETTLYAPSFPSSLKNPNALTVNAVQSNTTTTSLTYDGSAAKTLNIKNGTGISVSSDTSGNITINHSNSVTKGTAGTSSATSGASIDIPYVSYDAQGHITAAGTHKHTVSGFATTDTVPAAYCTTAAGTAAKTATHTGYVLTANTYELVTITTANTVQKELTLNINGTGAKSVYINGKASSSSNYTLPAGTYVVFYDGTNYQFRTDGKLPGTANSATTASMLGTDIVGNGTKPIYLNNGVATEGSQYAGGTAVTLNGDTKAASTASFYAPTTSGTAQQALIGSASGAPQWVDLIPASSISKATDSSVASGAAVKSAYDIANTANSTANTAKTNAATAQSTANTANSTANSAKSRAEEAIGYLTWQ